MRYGWPACRPVGRRCWPPTVPITASTCFDPPSLRPCRGAATVGVASRAAGAETRAARLERGRDAAPRRSLVGLPRPRARSPGVARQPAAVVAAVVVAAVTAGWDAVAWLSAVPGQSDGIVWGVSPTRSACGRSRRTRASAWDSRKRRPVFLRLVEDDDVEPVHEPFDLRPLVEPHVGPVRPGVVGTEQVHDEYPPGLAWSSA